MLHTHDIRFSYAPEASFHFPDIHCSTGETLLITGASGKGKTTLLHLLGGILQPSSGNISVSGTNIETLSGKQLDAFRGRNIGIIFQQSHFVQSLNVLENLLLAQWLSGNKKDNGKAMAILGQLNISGHAAKRTTVLSQGQQQRVSIARALINDPGLILADEPTSSLDDDHCMQVARLLQEQSVAHRAALVIVTHDQRLKNIFHHSLQLL
ncbi:MAG: ATP-binding cassette domain-containing protein [Agriterribacter sp.]